MRTPISDTGISIVYAPDEGDPLLDIVIVHGLQGHPFRTWASHRAPKAISGSDSSSPDTSKKRKGVHRYSLRRVISKVSTNASAGAASKEACCMDPSAENDINKLDSVYWPRDLAPQDCPRSRILVFGYDTIISKYMTGPTNKNHVLSHGKDLLYALSRERAHDRPLVFLAHSLGGIVVKEALAASAASVDVDVKNIVDSTAAVIFMGTPHRGSPDLSALGEWARSILSILRMETTSAILDTLGLKTNDLERAQESFSGLWSKYDFRVKTFQESLGLTGIHLGVLGNKVVPDYSSLLGDQRERAESIQANHMDMCRFTGACDPNYRKVAGELRSIHQAIQELNERKIHQNGLIQRQSLAIRGKTATREGKEGITDKDRDIVKAFRQDLKFPEMKQRYQSIHRPAEETCSWLFENELYQNWLNGLNSHLHEGLLMLKGKPGAGKSVLMKEAHRRMMLCQAGSTDIVATFFFNSPGKELERSREGMFRSLLYQLLPLYEEDADLIQRMRDDKGIISMPKLQEVFESVFSQPRKRRTFIFIDALDESEVSRPLAFFWRRITRTAYESKARLSVILSLRYYPHITLSHCPTICVDHCNKHGITLYVEQTTNLVAIPEQTVVSLKNILIGKSQGVFLWVILMAERMIEKWHEGEGLTTILTDGRFLPMELDTLFTDILTPVDPEAKELTIRLFQWATFSIEPLRLYEWHHILAFIRRPKFQSLDDWQTSDHFTESDDQLERQIKSISRGLLEVRAISTVPDSGHEIMSTKAGAGSLDDSHGETRVVEFIHQSVREFFLRGRGFYALDPGLGKKNSKAAGHLQIMETCLDYLDISELDALVDARHQYLYYNGSKDSQTAESPAKQDKVRAAQVSEWCQEPQEPHQQLRAERRSPEGRAFLESFKLPSVANCAIDIDQWVTSSQFQIRDGTPGESVCGSAIRQSMHAPTQLLQFHPALLSYATSALVWHASYAELADANPEVIIRRLQEGLWNRWLLLNEALFDSAPILGLHDFAERNNLKSWYRYTDSGTRDMEDMEDTADKDPQSNVLQSDVLNSAVHDIMDKEPRENVWKYRPHYAESVESFGSASSHRTIGTFQIL